jgi:hypothetical protein
MFFIRTLNISDLRILYLLNDVLCLKDDALPERMMLCLNDALPESESALLGIDSAYRKVS